MGEHPTVVYTTVHQAVMPYLREWADSVAVQTVSDFDVWVAIDGVSVDDVKAEIDALPHASLNVAPEGSTPAQVREWAFAILSAEYDRVVLVDADDVLLGSRVEAAVSDLAVADVSVCALRLIGEQGQDLGRDFCVLPSDTDPSDILPRWNMVGGSNSAFRAPLLARCLPLPAHCVAVDWYLATAAWAMDARFILDGAVRMKYRQYADNTAKVVAPFSADTVRAATRLVMEHHEMVLGTPGLLGSDRRRAVEHAAAEVRRFAAAVLDDEDRLEAYVRSLNGMSSPDIWWTIVAHPDLEALWRA